MTIATFHPGAPTFHPITRLRAAYAAHRAHARWVSDRLAEVDVSQLDRLDRWLSS